MKSILLADNITPIEKEIDLNNFFSTYTPKTSPFLLSELELRCEEYLKLCEYFNENNLSVNYFKYPIIFGFIISEFAYWTDDWETTHCFWGSFHNKFNICFSAKIYDTIRKGFKKLNVISQPKSGYRWVNWCTMQSILGRNALGRLAELVKYLKHQNIDSIEKLRKAFELSYIVDLKLAVLNHLYEIEPLIVLSFIDNIIKGKYKESIYFRKDEEFIDQFDRLLKQKFFYTHIFSSQYEYSKEPRVFLEWNDRYMKCHFFENAQIEIEDNDISIYKGRKIIAKYKNNIRTTTWQKKKILWAEDFNVFIQSCNQSIDFFSEEDIENRLFKLKLPILNEKDYWIFNSEGDLLNNQSDEIQIDINKNPFLYFVTNKVNELEDLNIGEYIEYENEEGYFIFKFLPNKNLFKENIGTNELIYENQRSTYFDFSPIFKNKIDSLPVLNDLPKIYFARDFFDLYNEIYLGINDNDLIEYKKIKDKLLDENSFYLLDLDPVCNWRNYEKYRIEILDKNLSSVKFLEFYHIADIENFQIRSLKDNQEVYIKIGKKGYKINHDFKEYKNEHSFLACTSYEANEIEFTIEHIKKERHFLFKTDLFPPTANVTYDNKTLSDCHEIPLNDLRNLPIKVDIYGQPNKNFELKLVSLTNKIIIDFGNDFKFSNSGKFNLGRIFWTKYYPQINKCHFNNDGIIRFSYEQFWGTKKLYQFKVVEVTNQMPIVRTFIIREEKDTIEILLEIEKLPIDSLKIYFFSSDFSENEFVEIEVQNRLPGEHLNVKKCIPFPKFKTDTLIYACLVSNDKIISDLKQIVLNDSRVHNPLSDFINCIHKNKTNKDCETKNSLINDRIFQIFQNRDLYLLLISFLEQAVVQHFFRNQLLNIFLNDKIFFYELLIKSDWDNQQKIIRFILSDSIGLDFFNLNNEEKKNLKQSLSTFNWQKTGLFEKLIRVHLSGYCGLDDDEILDWLKMCISEPITVRCKKTHSFSIDKFIIKGKDIIFSGKLYTDGINVVIYNSLRLINYENFVDRNNNIKFSIKEEYLPPFSLSSLILKNIKDGMDNISDASVLQNLNSFNAKNPSAVLNKWLFNLDRNSREIKGLFTVFHDYWNLSKGSQLKREYEKMIINIFKSNYNLFFQLLILRELISQWEVFKIGETA